MVSRRDPQKQKRRPLYQEKFRSPNHGVSSKQRSFIVNLGKTIQERAIEIISDDQSSSDCQIQEVGPQIEAGNHKKISEVVRTAKSLTSQSFDGHQKPDQESSSRGTEQNEMGNTFHEELPDFDHESNYPFAHNFVAPDDQEESAGALTGSIQDITCVSIDSSVAASKINEMPSRMMTEELNFPPHQNFEPIMTENLQIQPQHQVSSCNREEDFNADDQIGKESRAKAVQNEIQEAPDTVDESRSTLSAQAFIDKYRTKFKKFHFDSASKTSKSKDLETKTFKGVKSLYEKLKVDQEATISNILSSREEMMTLYNYNTKLLDFQFQV